MTFLPLFQPMPLRQLPPWDFPWDFSWDFACFRPLLCRLAGSSPALPDDMEDWQLRDLALTRPYPGPCRLLTPWLP